MGPIHRNAGHRLVQYDHLIKTLAVQSRTQESRWRNFSPSTFSLNSLLKKHFLPRVFRFLKSEEMRRFPHFLVPDRIGSPQGVPFSMAANLSGCSNDFHQQRTNQRN